MNAMGFWRVALVLFLVGAIANADARLDRESMADARMDLITSVSKPFNAYTIFNSRPSNSEACCDMCLCTRSIPPQCRCVDITEDQCHANCKTCACTLSIPAQCRCLDITNSCLSECSTESH